MDGFDPRWRDPPEYILGITKDIWEDRGIDTLLKYYGEDLVVRSPASIVQGNKGIIAATMATLAEFPDRQLFGEDVIWSEVEGVETYSFLSSHRLICTATHTGFGAYGPATGRKLHYRIIADCFCAENAVKDEWLVRDQSAIVRQMGLDPRQWTRDLITREGGPDLCVKPFTPSTDVAGPYQGHGNSSEWGDQLEDIISQLMSANFSAITQRYDRAAELHYPGAQSGHGHAFADRFWLGLRSSFPSAKFAVHHKMGQQTIGLPPRAALRWSLIGTHSGNGLFGAPTGAQVHVMGITHAEFGPFGVRREWTLIDETAIWKQILLQTG